jgi:hypothetical protein
MANIFMYGIDTHCYRIEEKASVKEPEISPEWLAIVLELKTEENGKQRRIISNP